MNRDHGFAILLLAATSLGCSNNTGSGNPDSGGTQNVDAAQSGSDAAPRVDSSVITGDASAHQDARTNPSDATLSSDAVSGRAPGETPETALDLNPDGETVRVVVPMPPGFGRTLFPHYFRVPYVRAKNGVIVRKLSGTGQVQVTVSSTTTPLLLLTELDGCQTPTSCGKEINFDHLTGATPTHAYIQVGNYFAGEYELELVALAAQRSAPTLEPPGLIRIATLWNASIDTGGTLSYEAPSTRVTAEAGPAGGRFVTYFSHLAESDATCWIRRNEGFEERVSTRLSRLTWESPSRPLLFFEPPTRGAAVAYVATGIAFGSNESGMIGIQRSTDREIVSTAVTTPMFTGAPTLTINTGESVSHNIPTSNADEWYMRFLTGGVENRRTIECRLPLTPSTPRTSITALTAAMGKDFQARGVGTARIEVGTCRRDGAGLSVPGTTPSSEATTLGLAFCQMLGIPIEVIERAF